PTPDVVNAEAPMLQAAIALASNDAQRALQVLSSATAFDRTSTPWLHYLRGLAYLNVRDHASAAAQFRTIIARRRSQPASRLHTLARLQLALALARSGDVADAQKAYSEFDTLWRAADAHP